MNAHRNARTTPYARALIVERHACSKPMAHIAAVLGSSARTVCRWLRRRCAGGFSDPLKSVIIILAPSGGAEIRAALPRFQLSPSAFTIVIHRHARYETYRSWSCAFVYSEMTNVSVRGCIDA